MFNIKGFPIRVICFEIEKNTEYSFGIDRNLFYYIGYSMPFMI